MALELYHWESGSNSGEPLICLHEKGLPFQSRNVDLLAFEQLDPRFLALNPAAQVPVLVHDGKVVTETGFILQYLEEVFPAPSLTPASAQGRYWVNVWIKYVNEYMAPAAWRLGVARHPPPIKDPAAWRARLGGAPLERRQAWNKVLNGGISADELEIAKALLPIRLERMEAALAESPWLAGPTFSLADIVVFPTADSLPALVPDLMNAASTPRIMAWLERMKARPAVRAAMAMGRAPGSGALFAPGAEGSRWG